MSTGVHPAYAAFFARIEQETVLAELLIARRGSEFDIRNKADRSEASDRLNDLRIEDVRSVIDYTASAQFRPLKSAPNLPRGWRLFVKNEEELERVLNQFYPNAVVDLSLVEKGCAPITNYRPFTARQSGMYRITTMLNDAQAANVIRACCHKKFCLKRRLWTVEGLSADASAEKSVIPCLEPCAILLEFARKGMRMEQEEKFSLTCSPSDLASIQFALKQALSSGEPTIREADFGAEGNPRRLQLVLEKLNSSGNALANSDERE